MCTYIKEKILTRVKFNLIYNFIFLKDLIRFGLKSSAKRNRIFNFFSNFYNSVRPNQTRAIYPNKALDSIDSMKKRPLTRVRFGTTES